MRKSLVLVLKIKSFKNFTAIYNAKILFAANIKFSINSHFLTAYLLNFTNEINIRHYID